MSDIEEIFEEAVPEKPKKRQLSQKQLDGLAKGRAKIKEKRDQAKKQREQEKSFTELGVKQKQDNRKKKRELKNISEEEEHRNHLIKLDENKKKLDFFRTLRTKYLKRCDNKEDFDELKTRLDAIEEEDILDNGRLKNKLIKMLDNYKK